MFVTWCDIIKFVTQCHSMQGQQWYNANSTMCILVSTYNKWMNSGGSLWSSPLHDKEQKRAQQSFLQYLLYQTRLERFSLVPIMFSRAQECVKKWSGEMAMRVVATPGIGDNPPSGHTVKLSHISYLCICVFVIVYLASVTIHPEAIYSNFHNIFHISTCSQILSQQ